MARASRRFRVAIALAAIGILISDTWTFATAAEAGREANNPVLIDDLDEVPYHVLGSRAQIRSRQDTFDFADASHVSLSLVVAPDGHVVSAEPIDGAAELYEQAVDAAVGWKYVPFERSGRPVYVRIVDHIVVMPREQRLATPVALPEIKNWNSLRITLSRTWCPGGCPVYAIEIRGDGTVTYDGDSGVAVGGRHRAHIPQDSVRSLFEAFRAASFFSALDKYHSGTLHSPTVTTTIAFDSHRKNVVDVDGLRVGLPTAIDDLEDAIVTTAGTRNLTRLTSQTIPALIAEGYFNRRETGTSVLATMIGAGASADVVRELIRLGAPVNTVASDVGGQRFGVPQQGTPLVAAAYKADEEIVRILLAAGAARNDRRQLSLALSASAVSRSPALAKQFLERGADPNFRDRSDRGITPLMHAAFRGAPETVEAMLSADARVNLQDEKGWSAIGYAAAGIDNVDDDSSPVAVARAATIRALAQAGADPNVCGGEDPLLVLSRSSPSATKVLLEHGADANKECANGPPPLISSINDEVTRLLLEADADPWTKLQSGQTVYDEICRYGDRKTCAVLKQWVNDHPRPSGR